MQVSFSKEQAVVIKWEEMWHWWRIVVRVIYISSQVVSLESCSPGHQQHQARFYVATMGSPTTSTVLKVRKGWLKLPGLTAADILKNHPHSEHEQDWKARS
jgi:hypothetical protein